MQRQFYTKQEEDDVRTTQITNPNRLGSGFINLGPQQRFGGGPAANWQTASLTGGPPPSMDNWSAPPPPATNGYGLHPPAGPPGMQMPAAPQNLNTAFQGLNYPAAPPALNTAFAPPPALNTAFAPPPALNTAFQGLNVGSIPPAMQAAFNPSPPKPLAAAAPPAFIPSPPKPLAAPAPPPPKPAPPPPKPAPPPAPKKPLTAADYAAMAQQYKPPSVTTPRASQEPSVQRTAVSQTTAKKEVVPLTDDELLARNPDAKGLIAAGVPREEVLAGLRSAPPPRVDPRVEPSRVSAPSRAAPSPRVAVDVSDDGWQTAGQKSRPQAAAAGNAAGKSKAQLKNEKRRAKK